MSSFDSSSYQQNSSTTGCHAADNKRFVPEVLPHDDPTGSDSELDERSAAERFLPEQVDHISKLLDEDPSTTMQIVRDESASQRSQPAAEPSSDNTDDDQSIADYMSQLLERVGQTTSSTAIHSSKQPHNSRGVRDTVPPGGKQKESTKTELPREEKPEEPRQPTKAPEGRNDLINLRQLANQSAHGALRAHGCRQLISVLFRRLVLAIVASICSCSLLVLSTSTWSFYYSCAVASMCVALYAGWQYAAYSSQLSHMASHTTFDEEQPGIVPDA